MHICPRCRKNKLYGDETRCIECTIEENKKAMKSRNKLGKDHYNKVHREWSRQSYKKCVENGICYVCRKSPADGGYKTCGVCREKQRTYKRIKYQEKIKMTRSERIERGLCYFCDNPQKKGYKVCEKHWQMNVKKSRNPKNHPWNTRNKYGFSKV